MTGQNIGAVLVVGGGIGGIQASLDLADSGFKVYLVESQTGIGGRMAQLDKTYPTNDCSTCIFSPKLLLAGQNPNIEIFSYSEVDEVRGWAGHFRVKIRKKSRFVRDDRCKGCGDCASECPVRFPNQFDGNLCDRGAIYRLFPQTIPQTFVIEKGDRAPCVRNCPANVNVQGYVQLLKQGKYNEALELIYEKVPLPGVLGRVCPHPCEKACRRAEKDEPVAVCSLKRFAADHADYSVLPTSKDVLRMEKVAVVGSGPAGLSAAYYLARDGYRVTIFESESVLGGWLRWGIPEYRLPRSVLEKEILHILSLGITVKTNCTLGKDFSIDDLKSWGYKAIFLGVGRQRGAHLPIPGIHSEGVVQGLDILRSVGLARPVAPMKKVVVIGGGNVAVDVARTIVRLGAESVDMVCLEARHEMPAYEEEIQAALEEGIRLQCEIVTLMVISRNGRATGLRGAKLLEMGARDASGVFHPVSVEGSEFDLEAETIIPAIGLTVDPHLWQSVPGLGRTDRNTIHINQLTYSTILKGVFAAGDAVTAPATVVEAIAGGRVAAESISRYLKGEDIAAGRPISFPEHPTYPPIPDIRPQPRAVTQVLPSIERKAFREVDLGLTEEDALREAGRCLNCGLCSECMQCVKVCKAQAVDHAMQDEYVEVDVGNVILATGYEPIDPSAIRGEFSYGTAANVVTNLEFERLLSASGPHGGEVKRPSDGKHPYKLAWIQCVGSRDPEKGMLHCSSICCMASIKEAVIAREHDPNVEPTIFYMDIRAHGKDFDTYYERAKNESGVRFVRSMVSRVVENPKTRDLYLTYLDENQRVVTETFEMVILAVGLKPSGESQRLAEKLGVELDESGFCATSSFEPTQTSRPGILVAGMFEAPKDIPGTVIQASAAAGTACRALAAERGTLAITKELPPEKDFSGQEPRIGVFVCRCGINIAATVNVTEVVGRVSRLPQVTYAGENLFTCSQDTQVKIKDIIEEKDLNRIVIASCTPRTHLPLFQQTAREAGLNKYLVEMANIREHCSWVHMADHEGATDKAVDLIRMAVARARGLEQISDQRLPVIQSALVIGGGVAGMTAALNIAEQGFAVHLLEASDKLGGNVWRVFRTMKKEPVRPYLEELIQKVSSSEDVSVYYNAQVEDVQGFIGNFKTKIRYNGDGEAEIEHGVTVIATGASEWKPDVYGYGTDPRIRTQLEMSAAMEAGDPAVMQAGCTVFIQCVGSRCEERPWCSKVCCNHTVMDAIALKEVNPLHNIYVLYRDMRTFGLNERYYEKARSMGVVFIRYEPDNPPAVEVGGKIAVTVQDLTLGRTMALEADNLVLAAAMVPNENNRELAKLFKVSTHQDGSYLEAHMKLRPVDFATDGIFLAGLAHHPKPLDESIAQAEAAGCHAAEVLARGHIEVPGMISVIDQFLCRGCSRCVDACPFQAPALKEVAVGVFRSEVNPALCKGCGICAVACPTGAAQVHHFKDQQIGVMIEAAMAAEAIGFPVEEEVAVGGEKVEELAPEVPVRVPVAPLIDETTTLDMVEGMLDAALTEEPVRDVMDEPPTYDRAKAMISAALKDSRLRQTLDVALKDERIGYLIDAARRDERLRDMIDEALTEKALREAEHPESASGDMIESERPESKAEKTTDEPPAT